MPPSMPVPAVTAEGEIRLRATMRLGQLSKELEKAEGLKGNQHVVGPSYGKKLKQKALAEAGISKSAAQRAEALAGARSDLDDEMAVEALRLALSCVRRGVLPGRS